MSSAPESHGFITPWAIVTTVVGFFLGGLSMAFNPLFVLSGLALVLCVLSLRSAATVRHDVVQGVLRIFAIIGIMGALGGIVVILFPGLGVGR